MNKIAILTLFNKTYNYGAVLQAFALSRVLNSNDFECEILDYYIYKNKVGIFNNLKNVEIIQFFISTIKKIIYTIIVFCIRKKFIKRKLAFNDFCKNEVSVSPMTYNRHSISSSLDKYSAFIVGSDQVWNYRFHPLDIDNFFLDFVIDKPKISYAASFGNDDFSDGEKAQIKEKLSDFSAISVREKTTKDALDKIFQGEKPIHWVLDPTLLMTKSQWQEVCGQSRINEKYIFAYFLGDNKKQRKIVKEFAKEKNLKIVSLPYLPNHFRSCDVNFGDYKLFDVSPFEFVSLIKNAEYIFTDSFHGTLFSINFEKEFYLFKIQSDNDVNSVNSRIYSILSLIDCPSRLINENDKNSVDKAEPLDYVKIGKILDSNRKYSMEFLFDALR